MTFGGAGVVRQDFERGALVRDERQAEPWKCYFSAVGKEIQQTRQQLDDANQQIATLQR